MTILDKLVDDDLIALKKTINYIFKQNATTNRKLMYDVFLKYILNCLTSRISLQGSPRVSTSFQEDFIERFKIEMNKYTN